jgi:hypothetical protein
VTVRYLIQLPKSRYEVCETLPPRQYFKGDLYLLLGAIKRLYQFE